MKYYIFGAGRNAKKLITKLRDIIEIEYIIDNDETKQGSNVLGIPIVAASILNQEMLRNHRVIVSVTNDKFKPQIEQQLNSLGLIKDKDYFNGVELANIFLVPYGLVSGYIHLPEKFGAIKSFDPASRLIKIDKNRILRVVNKEYIGKYKDIYDRCRNNSLFGRYIIDTHIVNEVEGLSFDLILEHEYVEPISYCFEWAPEMFADYVNFMLDFISQLSTLGLGITDGHTLNATIWKGKFVFLDFGALRVGYTEQKTLIEFINTHIIPLILFKINQSEKAYMYLKNPEVVITLSDVRGYLDDDEIKSVGRLYDIAIEAKKDTDILSFVKCVKEFINNFRDVKIQTRWEGYQNDEWDWSNDKTKWSVKMKNVIHFLKETRPESVVDLAGNMGWYGSFLHEEMKRVVIVDMDFNCVDSLWRRVQRDNISNVLPICMSVCAPTLDYYRDREIAKTGIIPWRKNAIERFKSEMVIALAIVHHLVFAQQLTFEEIIAQFSEFSEKFLIIEFIESSDQYITDFIKDGFEWYTKKNFEYVLNKHFEIINTSESTPSETRTIYLCEKRTENVK